MARPHTIVININLGDCVSRTPADTPSRPGASADHGGTMGAGGVGDIVDDAHDDAKGVVDAYLNTDAPIATVLRRTDGSFIYGYGCDVKTDLATLVCVAKDRLDKVGTPAEGKGPAYHYLSSTNLGEICVIIGDDSQGPPYPVLGNSTAHGLGASTASGSVYASPHMP